MSKQTDQADYVYNISAGAEIKVLNIGSFRDVLIIQNQSAGNIIQGFGSGLTDGIAILPNGHWIAENVPVNEIWIKNLGASTAKVIIRTDEGEQL
jgi:hypothetical protein